MSASAMRERRPVDAATIAAVIWMSVRLAAILFGQAATVKEWYQVLRTSTNVATGGSEKVKENDFNTGFNAATGEFVDMYDIGVVDPAKVTRTALQNATSIAAMVLTTECIIVDKQKRKK